jgi:hypothetical protein
MKTLKQRLIVMLFQGFVLVMSSHCDAQVTQAETPIFSHLSGTFSQPFELTITVGSATARIHYTLDRAKPTVQSPLYTGPLQIDKTTRIRAQVFEDGLEPSPVVSHGYLALAADVSDFNSNLPIVIVDTFGGNIDQVSLRPSYTVVLDGGEGNRTHISGSIDRAGRSGIKIRGSSSATQPKKQHRIEFWDEDNNDLDVPLLDLPADSDWLLNMPFNDLILMRNYLPQLWSRQMGQYGVRTRYVEVFINTADPDGPAGPIIIEDDFTHPAGMMPNTDPDGKGGPIPTGGEWTNYQLDPNNIFNTYDGMTHLIMPRIGGWQQYIDTRRLITPLTAGNRYAFICIFTLSAGPGTQSMGFASDPAWNSFQDNFSTHHVFKLSEGRIRFSNQTFSTSTDLDTGHTYIPGVPQGLKITINESGVIRLWYQNGNDKDKDSPAWVDITPASDPQELLQMTWGGNMIGVNNVGAGSGSFMLDYISLQLDTDDSGSLESASISMNDFYGIYMIMESIKRGSDRINIEKLDSSHLAEHDISGGYIMRHDRVDLDDSALPFGNGESNTALSIMEPKSHELAPAQKSWMINWLNSMEATLNGPGFHDPINGYAWYLDVDSFIDYDILGQIAKNNDSWRHSMYMFKDRNGRLTMGPPWDHDNGFAATAQHEGTIAEDWWRPPITQRAGLNPWYGWWTRLLEDPDYAQRWCDRWAHMRKGTLSEAKVAQDMDQVMALLSEAQVRNAQRWNLSPQNHANEVDRVKTWLRERMAWIDTQFLATPQLTITAQPSIRIVTLSAPQGQIYYTLDGTDPRQWAISSDPGRGAAPLTLVAESVSKRVLVPTGDIGTTWRSDPAFNDGGWLTGTGGVGYEVSSGYENFINIDLQSEMHNINASCYIRIPFTFDPADLVDRDQLLLRMCVDDGFTAWLNGSLIAEIRAPAVPQWNSTATTSLGADSTGFTDYNVSAFIGQLNAGTNLLAIQGLNHIPGSSDLPISAELVLSDQSAGGGMGGGIAPGAALYAGQPLLLTEATEVFARAYDGSRWSAPAHELITFAVAATGDVIISEFLANATGDDLNREWLELFNTTTVPIDINGWVLADNGSEVHTIDHGAPLVVPAKGHLVLGASADPLQNGEAPVTYAWGLDEFTLGNGGDEIILCQAATLVDAIGWEDFTSTPVTVIDVGLEVRAGLALGMGLDYCEGAVGFWREQSTVYGNNGDTGTPGTANDGVAVCAADTLSPSLDWARPARRDLLLLSFSEPMDPADVIQPEHYELQPVDAVVLSAELVDPARVLVQLSGPLSSGVTYTLSVTGLMDLAGNPLNEPAEAMVGFQTPSVSITEVMYNNRGDDLEWVELYNTTGSAIDLSGWYLSDDDVYPASGEGWVTLPLGTVLEARQYLVVDLWSQGGFGLWQMPAEVTVVTAQVGDPGNLSNQGDNLGLWTAATGGVLIEGSLTAEWPDLSSDGESVAKIDERFPWGDRETVSYNFAVTTEPIGFVTGLNLNNETLSDFATPGRPNRPADNSAVTPARWALYH